MQNTFQLLKDDPWLAPYEQDIHERYQRYKERLERIEADFGSLKRFSSWHKEMGLHPSKNGQEVIYKEWAPDAHSLSLVGDFNNWDESTHPLKKGKNGIWKVKVSRDALKHGGELKVRVKANNGTHDRLPTFSFRAVQNSDTHEFKTQYWEFSPFKWTDKSFVPKKEKPVIYECHIGMAQEKEGVGTYKEFQKNVLPRIKNLGYNYIQLMAVMEHPYYGSFGYHVSNFFAPTSRFGTPEELKQLIDKAHSMGIGVILDVVHSHAVKNFAEGLNDFDGSGNQFFHEGDRGYHKQWDSLLFNYGKEEVLRFLLSNLRYWMEEFHFDGFRFDGVTSMLYHHHGDYVSFDHYDKYFKEGVEWDAVTFLQLANKLIHKLNPNALSIAEDMSGMPGLCREIEEGGVGFDYRLGMGVPDFWIKLLKDQRDEDWNLQEIWATLNNRRWKEKTIAYVESHDQAMVGDKTTAFWLMDKEMYHYMRVEDENLIIDRGIALHKILRLLTFSLAGEGYMNFIGNEFGHPEWIDFPREGNNWSYKYARRQWSLVDHKGLKYQFLNAFDKAMVSLAEKFPVLQADFAKQLNMDEQNKSIAYERGGLIFIFNLHPSHSVVDYKFFVPEAGTYELVLNTDDKKFGGFDRVDSKTKYPSFTEDNVDKLSIYLPSRTMLVFKKKK